MPNGIKDQDDALYRACVFAAILRAEARVRVRGSPRYDGTADNHTVTYPGPDGATYTESVHVWYVRPPDKW